MSDPFQPSRDDGRSDWRTIFEHVSTAAPETTITYAELAGVLAVGLDPDVDIERDRIYRAVSAANKRLLRQHNRYLGVVRGTGYRVIRADEHLPVALTKKSAAVEQLAKGVELLRHVDLEDVPEAQRQLHQGQLMIMSGLHRAIVDSEQRHQRQEAIIDQIKARHKQELDEIRQRLTVLEAD